MHEEGSAPRTAASSLLYLRPSTVKRVRIHLFGLMHADMRDSASSVGLLALALPALRSALVCCTHRLSQRSSAAQSQRNSNESSWALIIGFLGLLAWLWAALA